MKLSTQGESGGGGVVERGVVVDLQVGRVEAEAGLAAAHVDVQ